MRERERALKQLFGPSGHLDGLLDETQADNDSS